MRSVPKIAPSSVLVIGDRFEPHFAPLVSWLIEQSSCRALVVRDMENCPRRCEPTLVLLLQSYPGQFRSDQIDSLRDRWPLARFAAIAGSWCEGESRSGRPLPGVYRIPWDAAIARLSHELPMLAAGRGALALPATATFEERAAANTFSAAPHGNVAIAALSPSFAEPLIDLFASLGAAAFFWPLTGGALTSRVNSVVWDLTGCETQLRHFHSLLPPRATNGSLVAIANFPRPQDRATLSALGVSHLLGKPLASTDLLTALASAATSRRSGQAA